MASFRDRNIRRCADSPGLAEFRPWQIKALVLQAGVTQPWTEAQFVPELMRSSYLTAFHRFGWAGDRVSKILFGVLVKFRDYSLKREDRLRVLMGLRLEEARHDPGFTAVIATMLRQDLDNRSGELNDVFEIFFSRSAYCRWKNIKAPTLIVHDPEDQFVPSMHGRRHSASRRHSCVPFILLDTSCGWGPTREPCMTHAWTISAPHKVART